MLRLIGFTMLMLCCCASASVAQPPPPPPPPLTPLPPPPQPAGNQVTPAKANLGKTLFWDEQLSSSRTVACGSCHQAATGGTDPRSRLASAHSTHPGPDGVIGTADDVTGSPGVVLRDANAKLLWSSNFGLGEQVTGRHAPSHVNAAYAPLLFWDGRAGGTFADPVSGQTILTNGGALENQASGPPVSSAEMGHVGRDWSDVAARVSSSIPLALSAHLPAALESWIGGRDYGQLFAEAFGSPLVTPARILMAIASYERTLFSTQAPFDSVIAGTAALAPDEAAGMRLFGQLPCARCHAGALTSNNAFHYIGVRPASEDSGRMMVTHDPADLGAFRTPSLRNVALRPAHMHDGRFSTLEEVVDFYDRGGDFTAPNKSPLITPLHLTPLQKSQLVAFLGRPLTDPRVANGLEPFDRPALYAEGGLAPEILAGGIAGESGSPPQPVALEPPLAGNPAFTVGVFGARGGSEAVLVIDASEPPLDQGIPAAGDFARVAIGLEGSGASDGYGSVSLAIPDDAAIVGKTYFGRWYVADASAPNGVAASSAFRFQVFGAHGAGSSLLAVDPLPTRASGVRLHAGWPNPFRGATTVRMDLLRPTRLKLGVYDVSGRLQRRLVDRSFTTPGVYSVQWDGRDDRGRVLAAGMYFYRLETDRGAEMARVVRIP
jgi:cytochrome c peroxidase